MNIDMTQVLTALNGEKLEELERYDNPEFVSTEETPKEAPQHTRKRPLTLRNVCLGALTNQIDSDRKCSGIEKNKQFLLSLRIQQEDTVDLTAEQITLLKDRIGKMCSVLVVGRSYEILDPVAKNKEPDDSTG